MRALVRPGASGTAGVAAMRERLARLGVTDVGVIHPSDPATELAAVAGALRGRTLLVDADLVVADACLGQLVDDPEIRSAALVRPFGADLPRAAGRTAEGRPPAASPPALGATSDAGQAREAFEAAPPAVPAAPADLGPAGGAPAPQSRSVALAAAGPDRDGAPQGPGGGTAVRCLHGRISSAASTVHQVTDPSHAFLGALVVDAADRGQAVKVLAAAADTARFAGWDGDPIDLALVALVRGQVPVGAVLPVGPVLRGGAADERALVAADIAARDEAGLLAERALTSDDHDAAYSGGLLARMSRPAAAQAIRLRVRPTLIRSAALVAGLGAAGAFSAGTWPAMLAGALLLQVALVLHVVGGAVARLTRSTSPWGAWLDSTFPPVTEFAAYAGLALAGARSGAELWLLATAAMALQTVRHIGDQGFWRVARLRESWVPARPLLDASDGGDEVGVTAPRAHRSRGVPGRRGAGELLRMPIASRWLVLGLAAVVVGPRWAVLLLVAWSLITLAATIPPRVGRSLRWRDASGGAGSRLLSPQLDLGPIGEPLWNTTLARLDPLARGLGWVWPLAMRVVELGAVWCVVARVAPELGAWLFAWTFVVAFHHHDLLARTLAGAVPPRWLSWFGLGWDGRTVLVALTGWAGAAALGGLLHIGGPLLALLFVLVSSVQWVRFLGRRSRRTGHA